MEKLTSYIYKLYELRDERAEAIAHLEKMAEDQVKMAEAFEKSEYSNDLAELANDCRKAGANYLEQKEILSKRVQYIDSVISAYESGLADENPLSSNKFLSNVTNSIVTYLFLGLGIVDAETKQDETDKEEVKTEVEQENVNSEIESTSEENNEPVSDTDESNTVESASTYPQA